MGDGSDGSIDRLEEALEIALDLGQESRQERALREDREHRRNRHSKHWKKRKLLNATRKVATTTRSVHRIRAVLAPTEL